MSNLQWQAAPTRQITVAHIFSGDLWAGAENMILCLLKELSRCKEVKLIALSLNHGILANTLQENGIETLVIPENGISLLGLYYKVLRALKGRRVTIIHSHRYKENFLAMLVGKTLGVKNLVTTVHGLAESAAGPNYGSVRLRMKTRIDQSLLNLAFSRVIAVSQDIKTRLVLKSGFNKALVELIYNGIDICPAGKVSAEGMDREYVHIGTVGRMVPVKDFDLYLRVAAEIKRYTQNVRFSILGDGPLKQELLQQCNNLGLEGYIRFEPLRANPRSYYQSLDVYLNTSLHEGLPLSILEAMACSVPIVGPKIGGMQEIISHGKEGFLVENRDQGNFVEHCLKLIRNRGTRITMGQIALKKVQGQFDSLRMAAAYKDLYQRICTVQ